MGSKIGMDRRFFARVERKPGVVLFLFGFVMIVMVGTVEGQQSDTTSTNESTSQPINVNVRYPIPVLNGQLVISNSNPTDAPTTGSPGLIANNNNDQSTPAGLVVSSSSDSTTTGPLSSSSNSDSSSGGFPSSTSQSTTAGPLAINNLENSTTTTPLQSVNAVSGSTTSGPLSQSSSDSTTAGSVMSDSSTQSAPSEDAGKALYARCQMKIGITCYGDKKDCIHAGNCTFLGAIAENDSFINVQLLTRTYNPPYHGVNLTVELSREKKGNDSVIRCSKPRFKSFKIKLSWTNKTTYEPGNETKLSNTLIDKNQLKAECLADQEKSNFTIPPSKTLALRFYIENKNDSSSTLVSQGLSQVSVQEPTVKNSTASDTAREGRNLDVAPKTLSKEDTLYEMCLKNTAKCFGDTAGCTDGHNCSFLGVIKETADNYHVYVVTKANPAVDQILTLTLNTPSDNSLNSTDSMSDTTSTDCEQPDFKDLSVQSQYKLTKLPLAIFSQLTNGSSESEVLETTVDKMTIKSGCESFLKDRNSNNTSTSNNTDVNNIMEEVLTNASLIYRFHLENGTLVPLGFSNESSTGNIAPFTFGLNGTALLVSENKGPIVMDQDDVNASPVQENSSPKMYFMSSLILCISTFITIYPSLA